MELLDWISHALQVLRSNLRWMGWNLLLAWIPLGLAIALFQTRFSWQTQSPLQRGVWLLGVALFVAFLPNAPYILTDTLHLIETWGWERSHSTVVLVILPQYVLFLLAGFAAYAVSLVLLSKFLQNQGWGQWSQPIQFMLHGLSAVGVYLGRFERFNSWDLATRPRQVLVRGLHDLVMGRSLLVIVTTFLVITVLFWITAPLVERLLTSPTSAAPCESPPQSLGR